MALVLHCHLQMRGISWAYSVSHAEGLLIWAECTFTFGTREVGVCVLRYPPIDTRFQLDDVSLFCKVSAWDVSGQTEYLDAQFNTTSSHTALCSFCRPYITLNQGSLAMELIWSMGQHVVPSLIFNGDCALMIFKCQYFKITPMVVDYIGDFKSYFLLNKLMLKHAC